MRDAFDGGHRFRVDGDVLAGRHVDTVEFKARSLRCGWQRSVKRMRLNHDTTNCYYAA